jgi:cytochrome c-type biogenesis protein
MQGFIEFVIQLGASFGAGLYVAISPCLFPLLPLFLIRTLQSEGSRSRSVLITSILILGILTSIGIFAIISGLIGYFLIQNFKLIRAILGGIIIIFGVLMISEKLKTRLGLGTLSLKAQPSAPKNLVSVYVIGLGYTLMAAPCAAPSIFALSLLFGTQSTIWGIILMFLVVSIGVALPYLAIALVSGEAQIRMATTISRSARRIELVVGVILVIIGIILILPHFGFPVFL